MPTVWRGGRIDCTRVRQFKCRMKPKTVTVNDKMQKRFRYVLTETPGKNFDPEFKPELTPKQMLKLGVFGGKYMTDCRKEFPTDWFKYAKLCSERHDPELVRVLEQDVHGLAADRAARAEKRHACPAVGGTHAAAIE